MSSMTKRKLREICKSMASIGNIPWNKGKTDIYSRETIEKMKNARKGKSAFWNVGKVRTLENKLKISETLTGRVVPIEVRKKMGVGRRGSSNPLWKGGITSIYRIIRSIRVYIDFIQNILKLDNYICQNCFAVGKRLEVHHIKYFSILLRENNIKNIDDALKCKALWDEKNCITLCIDCHRKQQKERITWVPVGHRSCEQNMLNG